MVNNDSIIMTEIKTYVDSLNCIYTIKLDSLSTIINQNKISEKYFQDILSHQWTLLSIQTAIFIFIILFILGIAGFISWKYFFKNILDKTTEAQMNLANMPDIIIKLNDTTNHALRALYESTTNRIWKIVWHIRYLEWFANNYNKNNSQDTNRNGIIVRCQHLKKEYDALKASPEDHQRFKNFENKGGLKRALKKLIDSDIKEIMPIVLEIFGDLQ